MKIKILIYKTHPN